jgi:hypothetical protein
VFEHVFGENEGWMVTFTGRQARLERDARENELSATRQRSYLYPQEVERASDYLLSEGERGRDAYYGVHLFRERGSRRSSNAAGTLSCCWLDEDSGRFPAEGPEPTAIVRSSEGRRHLYWRLIRPLSAEWVVAMNRRIARWAGGDVGKAGLATVLRPPGTFNYKRHPIVDRVVGEITGVPAWEPEVIEQAIPTLPQPQREGSSGRRMVYDGPEMKLLDYLESAAVEIIFEASDDGGAKFAIVCPRIDQHTGGDRSGTYVGQYQDGALWFHCYHESCQSYRGWSNFRRLARPKAHVAVGPPREREPRNEVVIRLGR